MRSPFPGMDPYLEPHWGDVHGSLIQSSKVALQGQLGGDLIARSEERVYIDGEDETRRQHRIPDIRVVEQGFGNFPFRPAAGVAIAEPVVVEIQREQTVERFLQVIDFRDNDRVITIIEFLSPSNKTTKSGRESYEAKREECLAAGTNFVEIDLTRAGVRRLLMRDRELPSEKRGQYMAVVHRAYAGKFGRNEGYGLKLRERLPGIRIPLRSGDPDIVLDLQSVLDQAYEAGAYGRSLRYDALLDPPLDPADAEWAAELTAERRQLAAKK